MKKILIFSFILLSANLAADVVKIENFDYPYNTDLLEHGWTTSFGTATSSGIIVSSPLEFNYYEGSAVGGSALINCVSHSEQAHLHFDPVTDGSLYVAFLFQPAVNYATGYFICLRDEFKIGSYTQEYNLNARAFISEDYHIGLTFANNQNRRFADRELSAGQVYLCVLKYEIVEGSNNDRVSLFLFDNSQYADMLSEPAQPLIGPLSDSAKQDIYPANLQLRGFDSDSWLFVDGIRVATTWQEAVALHNLPVGTALTAHALSGDVKVFTASGLLLFSTSADMLSSQLSQLPHGMYLLLSGGTKKIVLK